MSPDQPLPGIDDDIGNLRQSLSKSRKKSLDKKRKNHRAKLLQNMEKEGTVLLSRVRGFVEPVCNETIQLGADFVNCWTCLLILA